MLFATFNNDPCASTDSAFALSSNYGSNHMVPLNQFCSLDQHPIILLVAVFSSINVSVRIKSLCCSVKFMNNLMKKYEWLLLLLLSG